MNRLWIEEMKPLICICCGEKISSKKSETSKNPNVCQPCEYLVETGTIPALQKLIQVLTGVLMRSQGAENVGTPLNSTDSESSNGHVSERKVSPCHPVIHPKFIEEYENSFSASNAGRN
jgi:hypothetical protein